mmetsp:Transcript_37461/g.87070  ORF Transcript_37461/g.87070 Transcript_37461/m.87070 type:complete len:130 (-) Transcript_37461:161-550(-)
MTRMLRSSLGQTTDALKLRPLASFLLLAVLLLCAALLVCPTQPFLEETLSSPQLAHAMTIHLTGQPTTGALLGDLRDESPNHHCRSAPSWCSTPEREHISMATLFVAGALSKLMASAVSSNDIVLAIGL